MGFDQRESGSSSASLIIVCAVGLLFFVGLFLVGGLVFFVRGQSVATERVQVAMMERDRAAQAARRAEAVAVNAQGVEMDAVPSSPMRIVASSAAKNVDMLVFVAADGSIRLDGVDVKIADLSTQFANAARSGRGISVSLTADSECPFQHISAILESCEQAGISNVQVRPTPAP